MCQTLGIESVCDVGPASESSDGHLKLLSSHYLFFCLLLLHSTSVYLFVIFKIFLKFRYNSYGKIHLFKVYNSLVLVDAQSMQPSPVFNSRTFQSPQI